MNSPKFHQFSILETTYKIVNGHKIEAYAFIPKDLPAGKHPLVAHFHGGFFVTGAALYPDWWPQWALDYCIASSAIIVSANYRLLPESTGLDILEDVSDFWEWVKNGLQKELTQFKSGIEVDLTKTIVYGGSAGGTLAIQSGIIQPPGLIKAVVAAYPGLGTGEKAKVPILGAPTFPTHILEEHLKNMKPGEVITAADPPARFPIAISINQQGRKREFFGSDEKLYPMIMVEKVDHLPFMFIFHGKDDTAVLVEASTKFAEKVVKRFGEEKIDFHIEPGEHGFDSTSTLDMPWLKQGLEKVTRAWLGERSM